MENFVTFEVRYKDAFVAEVSSVSADWKEEALITRDAGARMDECLKELEEKYQKERRRFEVVAGLIRDEEDLIVEMRAALDEACEKAQAFAIRAYKEYLTTIDAPDDAPEAPNEHIYLISSIRARRRNDEAENTFYSNCALEVGQWIELDGLLWEVVQEAKKAPYIVERTSGWDVDQNPIVCASKEEALRTAEKRGGYPWKARYIVELYPGESNPRSFDSPEEAVAYTHQMGGTAWKCLSRISANGLVGTNYRRYSEEAGKWVVG